MEHIEFQTGGLTLLFASQNNHKKNELMRVLQPEIHLLSLRDLGYSEELSEDYDTIEENAIQKARFIYDKYQRPTISEDTALEVEALQGKPGVHTAHYAGPDRNAMANMLLLLEQLRGERSREAQFRTVICLMMDGNHHLFEGICRGSIAEKISGNGGFGYDPIFIPEGFYKTFAELPSMVKENISHRTKAAIKMKQFLKSYV